MLGREKYFAANVTLKRSAQQVDRLAEGAHERLARRDLYRRDLIRRDLYRRLARSHRLLRIRSE